MLNRTAKMRGTARRIGSFKPKEEDQYKQNSTPSGQEVNPNINPQNQNQEPGYESMDRESPASGTYNRKFSRCVMDGIRSGASYTDAKKKCNA